MPLFYIIAAGPSYMDVTDEEWNHLKDKHTLTFARVPYGSRKTEYYMSIERDYIDKSVLTYMAKLGYLDTKLLLSIPQSLALAKQLGFKSVRKIFKQTFYFMPSRRPWFSDEESPPHSFYECRAHSFHQPIFRFRGQLIAAINCALILGATEIRLIAVDLNSQLNFYQYADILNKVCKDKETIHDYMDYESKELYVKNYNEQSMEDKKKTYPQFNPEKQHLSNLPIDEGRWGGKKLRGISDVIQWIDKELQSEGFEGVFITNKDSLLFKENKLRYRSINE